MIVLLEKQASDYGVLGTAHPLSIMKSVVQRILLFTWWSGFWFYEGTERNNSSEAIKQELLERNRE